MAHDDARDAAASTLDAIVRDLREKLNAQFPGASVKQIEAEITRRLAAGAKPTTAVVPVSPGIPKEVLAARRAERRKVVNANHHRRRG
ncbi:hypothetical protein [Paracraurococcus lichenis]|uniref:Uncharacterized protein n=1 Tax=Paracraurococcus lichenis TaxID=3064888 RepID=A0ABT9EE55_9PROT|nr:hypothetical protein [Paracraurococcus sp. LOR1-02]MDO9714290.1 hypothetical protein [Paracraurococcus sp. LOR1-02]